MHGAVLGLWVKRFFEPAEPGSMQSPGSADKNEAPGEKREKSASLACAGRVHKQGEAPSESLA
jgi:hypothetical protein